jgi:uncharacterized membrane protein YccC
VRSRLCQCLEKVCGHARHGIIYCIQIPVNFRRVLKIRPFDSNHETRTMPIITTAPKASNIEAFIFTAKAALSCVFTMLFFDFSHLPGAIWGAISAVIVTQPGLHPSVRASLMRVIANVIGAFIGAVFVALLGHTLYALAGGVMITGLVCHFTRLDDAVRSAYAAVVIVMLNPATGSTWFNSLERVYAVILGCLVALLMGFLCDVSTKRLRIGTIKRGSTIDSE